MTWRRRIPEGAGEFGGSDAEGLAPLNGAVVSTEAAQPEPIRKARQCEQAARRRSQGQALVSYQRANVWARGRCNRSDSGTALVSERAGQGSQLVAR